MPYASDVNDLDHNRVYTRWVDEFMGIAKVLTRLPCLERTHILVLDGWFSDHIGARDHPLIYPIAQILYDPPHHELLKDSKLRELHATLRKLCGTDKGGQGSGPTELVLDEPAPRIEFDGKRFCFTGTFDYGGRWECEEAILERGGTLGPIAKSTDYLVIGASSTVSWKHSSFGTKITSAMRWRTQGAPIQIVSEDHWTKYLDNPATTDEPPPRHPVSPYSPSPLRIVFGQRSS